MTTPGPDFEDSPDRLPEWVCMLLAIGMVLFWGFAAASFFV